MKIKDVNKVKVSKKVNSNNHGGRQPRDKSTGLSIRETEFINKYLETTNATEAAIYAGYSKKTAGVIGCQLLKNLKVKGEIEKRLKEKQSSAIASAQEVMEYLTKVMKGEIQDQFGLEAPLAERTRAAIELAKRTVDLEAKAAGKVDSVIEIKLDWKREEK